MFTAGRLEANLVAGALAVLPTIPQAQFPCKLHHTHTQGVCFTGGRSPDAAQHHEIMGLTGSVALVDTPSRLSIYP